MTRKYSFKKLQLCAFTTCNIQVVLYTLKYMDINYFAKYK